MSFENVDSLNAFQNVYELYKLYYKSSLLVIWLKWIDIARIEHYELDGNEWSRGLAVKPTINLKSADL